MCAAIFLIVIAAHALRQFRSRTAHTDPGAEPRFRSRVLATSIATAVILVVFLVVSVATGKAVSTFSSDQGVVVQVTGHQWWWEFRYPDQDPSRTVVTANEIHIPVGRPVLLRGTASDVTHSLWSPNLNGKRDLIPSRTTTQWIQADRPGVSARNALNTAASSTRTCRSTWLPRRPSIFRPGSSPRTWCAGSAIRKKSTARRQCPT